MRLRYALAGILAVCFAGPSLAYEWENAVPLTLGMQRSRLPIDGVHIKLNGHEVDIAVLLRNDTQLPQHVGFYAATPLFESHGEGEEYADKTFADLKAFQDGKPIRISRTPRAYFLGQDITPILRKAGIDPIPSNEGDWRKKEKLPFLQSLRLQDWQGQISFGWSTKIAAGATATETIRYTAMPRFGLEMLDDGEDFNRLVQLHCGRPEELRDLTHRAAPKATQVMAEVFQFPLPFVQIQDTHLTIEKASKRWLGAHPIAALACGFDGPLAIPSNGVIEGANNSISILVVSLLDVDVAPEEAGTTP